MSVSVQHTLDDLVRDTTRIARTARSDMAEVVRLNTACGMALAQNLAREKSGPHGKNYWKRISMEMTDPLSGVYGPTGVVDGNAVGAGWRHGDGNLDLARSVDVQGPKFAEDVRRLPNKWFW